MAYPFVAAESYSRGGTPVKAIAIHMAEGGGTVSWLTHPDGNSSHYVVEYTGRIVQMVREVEASGSINPSLLRRDDDNPFTFLGESITYGVTAARAALGIYWSNPNAAVIAIETEGFAADGPNSKQRTSLAALVADIRTRFPGIPALGHRDFQNYKACPGKKIPWVDYGGHGSSGDSLVRFIKSVPGYQIAVKAGTKFYLLDGADSGVTASKDMTLEVVGSPEGSFTNGAAVIVSTGILYSGDVRPTVLHVKQSNISPAPAPVDDTPYSQADLDAAVAAAQSPASVTYPVNVTSTVTIGNDTVTVGPTPAGSVTLP